jgi:putative ubiquitin-RnfH superfamily antitoxin RatB of RatAB toxin-antitoxin module
MAEQTFIVEIAYATPARQVIIPVEIEPGTTATQAIALSAMVEQFPELDLTRATIGIFGQVCPLNTLLKQGDRVEIYRPLLCDPKQARRNRALGHN